MRQKLRTLEALILLCLCTVAIRLLPTRWLLRAPSTDTPDQPEAIRDQAVAIRGGIRSASARLPFKPTCLAQSLAATLMLRRRAVPHRLHIGARKDPDFQAHAWVEAAGLVVAGEGEVGNYSVLLTRAG